jgi:ribonuclease P protein component
MLSRTNRFHGLGSLRYAYRSGQTVRGQLLSLKYARNDRRKAYRAAVVVSKKVNKSAVVRNRIRRRVYEALQPQANSISGPYDLVFTVFSDRVATMPMAELQQTIRGQLNQSGVIIKGKGIKES